MFWSVTPSRKLQHFISEITGVTAEKRKGRSHTKAQLCVLSISVYHLVPRKVYDMENIGNRAAVGAVKFIQGGRDRSHV